MDLNDLTNKTAIVTGAAQGLSCGMAEGLMEAGAKVCIMDINPKAPEVAQEYTRKGFQCFAVVTDLGNDKTRETAFQTAVEKLGGHLDIIVNGAGVQKRYPSEDFPLSEWDFVINVNLRSVFALCQLAGKTFLKQGGKGKIINIASMLSFFGGYTVPAYMATDMNTALLDPENPRNAAITERIPYKKWGTPEDMKGPVVWLASDASDYINGAVVPVDGGYLVR